MVTGHKIQRAASLTHGLCTLLTLIHTLPIQRQLKRPRLSPRSFLAECRRGRHFPHHVCCHQKLGRKHHMEIQFIREQQMKQHVEGKVITHTATATSWCKHRTETKWKGKKNLIFSLDKSNPLPSKESGNRLNLQWLSKKKWDYFPPNSTAGQK